MVSDALLGPIRFEVSCHNHAHTHFPTAFFFLSVSGSPYCLNIPRTILPLVPILFSMSEVAFLYAQSDVHIVRLTMVAPVLGAAEADSNTWLSQLTIGADHNKHAGMNFIGVRLSR